MGNPSIQIKKKFASLKKHRGKDGKVQTNDWLISQLPAGKRLQWAVDGSFILHQIFGRDDELAKLYFILDRSPDNDAIQAWFVKNF